MRKKMIENKLKKKKQRHKIRSDYSFKQQQYLFKKEHAYQECLSKRSIAGKKNLAVYSN